MICMHDFGICMSERTDPFSRAVERAATSADLPSRHWKTTRTAAAAARTAWAEQDNTAEYTNCRSAPSLSWATQVVLSVNLSLSLLRVGTSLPEDVLLSVSVFSGLEPRWSPFCGKQAPGLNFFSMQFLTLLSDSAQIQWEFLNHFEGFENVALYLWGSLHSQS